MSGVMWLRRRIRGSWDYDVRFQRVWDVLMTIRLLDEFFSLGGFFKHFHSSG